MSSKNVLFEELEISSLDEDEEISSIDDGEGEILENIIGPKSEFYVEVDRSMENRFGFYDNKVKDITAICYSQKETSPTIRDTK